MKTNEKRRILVIGWYGSETIGDRAILDGIITFFKEYYSDIEISIASINDYFSLRTVHEDLALWDEERASVIDVFNRKKLLEAIKESDYVVFGGGPIMSGINELELMARIFMVAKKHKKKTIIFGCSIEKRILKTRLSGAFTVLIQNTDVAIFRDVSSVEIVNEVDRKCKAYFAPDPAIYSVCKFQEEKPCISQKEYIAINFRNLKGIHLEEKVIYDELQSVVEALTNKGVEIYME